MPNVSKSEREAPVQHFCKLTYWLAFIDKISKNKNICYIARLLFHLTASCDVCNEGYLFYYSGVIIIVVTQNTFPAV